MEHKVILYGTKTCVFCRTAKEMFEDKKIPYTYKDVGEDSEAREYMVKASGQMGVPVIEIDGVMQIGFKRSKIEKALGLAV